MKEKFISLFSKLSNDEKLKIISGNLYDQAGFLSEVESLNIRQSEK